jgi:hypothetical protein
MKWLIVLVVLLAVPLAVVLLVGSMLPRKHRVSRTASLRKSPDAVFQLISGPPSWRPDIRSYAELPSHDGHRMWSETDKTGQTITYEAMESVGPRRLVTRIADPKLPFGGTWTYEITPVPEGCTLTITEDGEVYNPVFRFVSRFIFGHAATLTAYMKALHVRLG